MYIAQIDRVNYRLKKSCVKEKKDMEELKSLFGENALTYDEFEAKVNADSNIKLANLKTGMYVDKSKLDKSTSSFNELEAKYNKLVEDTKTYEADKAELEAYKTEKANNELLSQISNAKVDSKYSKFVLSEVKSAMKDNEKFEDVLTKYVKDNPQYLTIRQGIFKTGASTPNLEQGNPNNEKTENQTMNELIRNRGE